MGACARGSRIECGVKISFSFLSTIYIYIDVKNIELENTVQYSTVVLLYRLQ